jgi:TRAP transporter TAXI family solute receptor
MIIRRYALLAVCVILALAILLPACAKPAPTTPSERPQNVELTIFGFVAGTGQMLRTDSIAEAIRVEYPDWKVTSLAAGGEAQLISKRIAGEADFFLTPYLRRLEIEVQTPLHSEIDFEQATAYSLVMPVSIAYVHFFAMGRTGLTSIREIVDKKLPLKVGVGPGGSSLLFSKILEHYGTSWAEAESWGLKREIVYITTPEGAEALEAGRVDIGLSWTEIPSQAYIGVTFDLKLLPVDDPGLVQMLKELGYYEATIPADTYPFITEDIPTVAQTEFLAVRPDMPEDIVYSTLKALLNHKEILIAANAGSKLTPEAVAESIVIGEGTGVPFHPGALKFFREIGWIE